MNDDDDFPALLLLEQFCRRPNEEDDDFETRLGKKRDDASQLFWAENASSQNARQKKHRATDRREAMMTFLSLLAHFFLQIREADQKSISGLAQKFVTF